MFESNSNNSFNNNTYTNVLRNSVPSSPDSIGKCPQTVTARASSSSPSPKPSTPTGNFIGSPFPTAGSPRPSPPQHVSMGTIVPPPSPKRYSKPSSPLTTEERSPFQLSSNTSPAAAAETRATSPLAAAETQTTPPPTTDAQRMSPVAEEAVRPVSCLKSTDTTRATSSFDNRAGAINAMSTNHSVKFSLDIQTTSSSTQQATLPAEDSTSPIFPKPSPTQSELPDVTSVGMMSPQSTTTQVKVSSTPPFEAFETPTFEREATPQFSVANQEDSNKTASVKEIISAQVTSTVITPQKSPQEIGNLSFFFF